MKIIRHGVRPPETTYKGHCSYCGCVFEAKESEMCSTGPVSIALCPELFCRNRVPCKEKLILEKISYYSDVKLGSLYYKYDKDY